MKQLRRFMDADIQLFPEFRDDTTLEWYRENVPGQGYKRRDWGEKTFSWGVGDLYKHVILWKEIRNWKYFPIDPSREPTVLERNYYIYPKRFGLDEWTLGIRECIGYWQSHGWNLLYSEGPRAHPGVYVAHRMDNVTGRILEEEKVDCSDMMKKMPEDWAEWKLKSIECTKAGISPEQEEFLNKLVMTNAGIIRDVLAQVPTEQRTAQDLAKEFKSKK